jgi:hypothetical protein
MAEMTNEVITNRSEQGMKQNCPLAIRYTTPRYLNPIPRTKKAYISNAVNATGGAPVIGSGVILKRFTPQSRRVALGPQRNDD